MSHWKPKEKPFVGSGIFDPRLIKGDALEEYRAKQPLYNIATPPSNQAMTMNGVQTASVISSVHDLLGQPWGQATTLSFSSESFNSYIDGLGNVARDLRALSPACVLVPLRGGLKPRQIVDGMTNHALVFEEFSFTGHTKPDLALQYEAELSMILSRYAARGPNLTLAVLDCAIGGDGGNHLAKILQRLHAKIGGTWTIVFHILHVPRPNGSGIPAIRDKGDESAGLVVQLKEYPVRDLMFEDRTPAMGILGRREGSKMIYYPYEAPGAIYVGDKSGLGYLVVSNDLRKAVDKIVSHLGTKRISETYAYRIGADVYEANRKRFEL